MYQYDEYDRKIVFERAEQFARQVERRISGDISELQFKPLRLQNGLYMQLQAYMLRVAIPYGLLSSKQLRMLAHIARKYDRGYGHFSTRQNIQYNWPKLEEVPDLLRDLASVEMHAIQTSGNCIRNITSDHFAGVARDELADPRPIAEIMRQWSTFHPEFAYLPRKFKIAITGAPDHDRAAVRVHDIGIRILKNDQGQVGCQVIVGGGLCRTPVIGKTIRPWLPTEDLLSYLEAILRVYNQWGDRKDKFKARIKILVNTLGQEEFTRRVEEEWAHIKDGAMKLTQEEIDRVSKFFVPPAYKQLEDSDKLLASYRLSKDRNFGRWAQHNVDLHKVPGYSTVYISLKTTDTPPGDASDTQMDAIAQLADDFSFSEIVATHTQNLVLPHVETEKLPALYEALAKLDLARPNQDLITDIICCPGLDFCDLANARSIPQALEISKRFEDLDYQHDIGELNIKMSGCINACGHHHVGHIGILGINKRGEEAYQLSLGGAPGNDASLGKIVGPAFPPEKVVDAVEKVVKKYLALRTSADERFLDCYRRVGMEPFKEAAYAAH
ncbi:MAG TPA: nitrite/sulfite reductase [Polyangiales bacterium]